MTTNIANRRTAGAITAALVLGTAGPAVARPFDLDAQGSMVPAGHIRHAQHYGKANVLVPYTGSAINYGQANVLPSYTPPAQSKPLPKTTAPAPTSAPSAHPNASHTAPGSDLVYVLIGGVVLAVGGLGGTLVAASRRRAAAPPSRTAA